MWSADDRLVWTDSSAADLPHPLPPWLEVVGSRLASIVVSGCYIVLTTAYVVLVRRLLRAWQKV